MTTAPPAPMAAEDQAPATWSTVPILIVDDNPAKRLALKAVLAPLGYPIVEADSGLAALRCVIAQDFAVILLDVFMPTMDGFETAAVIRQRRQSEMTPIIFVTAFGSDEIVNTDRYAAGAVDFIFAPVEPDDLRAKVSVFANLFIKSAQLETRADEAQTSADHLRLLTDAAPIGIFQTDMDNRYVYTNPRWSEITGVASEEAAGQPWDIILDPGQRADLAAELSTGAHRAELGRRFTIRRPGSAQRVVLVTSVPIPGTQGRATGWVGTVADVTAEAGAEAVMAKGRDEATAALRLKADFLANMSHEIRTPMNGVIGMTDLLLDTDLDSRQRDYAQTVRNSGEALLAIINDILDFSKMEAGKLEIDDIEFNLRRVVDDVVDLLAGSAQTKELELVAVTENSLPAVVSGDPGRLRQVLTNLIGNAIKFTQTGEVVIRVSQGEISLGSTVVRFEVSDTGDGIAPDKLAAIFEPFVQADTSTSREYGGTGLGLAISSQLVALMGGDCGVSSVLGGGSTFWFTVRVHVDQKQGLDGAATDDGLRGARALVADDNATQRKVLSEYLSQMGMAVTTADSGPGALDVMRAATIEGRPFAIAIVDQSMAGVDEHTLKMAVEADPGIVGHIVLMRETGRSRSSDVAKLESWAYLSKPVHHEDLLTCVHNILGSRVVDLSPALATITPLFAKPGPDMGRLLLAEDNPINQKVAMAILSGANYRVDMAHNGAEAVQAAAVHAYDAILMDCQMPVLNGYQATAAIRGHEGPSRHTPIIALTASARREDRERCLAAGMDSYLAKPLSKDALLALVAQSVMRPPAGAEAPATAARPAGADITLDMVVFEALGLLGAPAGEEFLGQLVNQFVDETGPRLVQLRQALAAGDAVAIARVAHSLLGASGQLGGRRLASSCRRLETKAGMGRLLDVHADLDEIDTDYEDLRRILTGRIIAAPTPAP